MDNLSNRMQRPQGSARKSELDKFKLFYEFATPTREVHSRIRRSLKS